MMVLKRLHFKYSIVFEGGEAYYAILSINIYWINKHGSPVVLKKSCKCLSHKYVQLVLGKTGIG